MKRVVVTGLGVCAAPGKNAAEFAASLSAGKSAIGPIVGLREGLATKIAAQVKDFDPTAYFDATKLSLLDRCSQFALVAAREAIAQSGLNFREGGLGARSAAILGVGAGGQSTQDDNYWRVYGEGAKRLHPFTIPRLMANAPASHITMEHGITGTSFVISSACSSANHAIGTAFQMIRAGMSDVIVSGGTEAVITYGTIRGWEALRVMAPDTCRPFSVDRKGMVLGEGAAVIVLEERDRAMKRGADILCEVIGFGATSDAGDIVMPAVAGCAGAINACLADAGLNPSDVDYINAHGTATAANDVTETKALHAAFGDHARKLAVSSTKSIHGHTLGAAGAVELAATIQGMRGGFIPPTANFTTADPQCDLDYVPNEARAKRIDVAISNSFAFGGHNAVVAVRRA